MNGLVNVNFFDVSKTYGDKLKQPFDLEGTVIVKEENTIKIELGNKKVIEAVLKNPLEENVGEQVFIDKADIVSMKVCNSTDGVKAVEKNMYEEILKKYDIEVNDESIEAVKELTKCDVPVNKENIKKMIVAKKYLHTIHKELNHDVAVKLIKNNIDIKNESLHKITTAIKEIKEEEETSSVVKLLNVKKDMTTEEAEKIAKQIYGNKMGKDITDIVKALHKVDTSITKKNVEKVYDVFYKLDKIEKIKDDTFIGVYKKNIEPTIENLYNIKHHVSESVIYTKDENSAYVASVYEEHISKPLKVTESDLIRMEDAIGSRLKNLEIVPTKENIELSKEMIKANIPITKEYTSEIIEIKEAFKEVNEQLDIQKVSQMIKTGINIEKIDIREVVNFLTSFDPNFTEKVSKDFKKVDYSKRTVENISKMGKEKESIIPLLIKNEMDFSLKEIENISLFLKNEQQMGQKIGEIVQMTGAAYQPQWKNYISKLERLSKNVSNKLKSGDVDVEKSYHELIEHVENMEKDMSFSEEKDKEQKKKEIEDLVSSIRIQKKVNKQNLCLQLPLVVGNQFKNLQIYVANSSISKGKENEPLTVILNLDTNKLGKMNTVLKIDKKEVSLAIGIKGYEEKQKLEKYTSFLEEMLQDEGYVLKDIAFKVEEDGYLLKGLEDQNKGGINPLLNITI